MELREMRVFVAIVEEGSLSAAARRLHLSQPALSQTVGSLERQLGVRLLVRSSAGMAATPEGRTLLDESRAVLARHDQALVALDRQRAREVGVLRLGLPLDVPPALLVGPLGELAAAYPATGVQARHLAPALLEAALRRDELDTALLRERPRGQELDSLLVLEEPLGALLTTRQAERLGGPDALSLEALAGLRWMGFPREDAPGYFDELTAVLRAHGIEAARAVTELRAILPAVVYASVAAADGAFALAPRHLACLAPDGLTWCPLAGNPLIRRTWAAWSAGSHRRDLGHFIAAFDIPERQRGLPVPRAHRAASGPPVGQSA
ncbi:LysR family transcriptional regulator [Streptomyces hokutonensis]|uniref:LysR family transcriptional regulator n=1 Tax=Streptomyces hokutonensis TaxID=1306990 RepID=A0ABW6M4W8_9ACTN